MPANLTNTPQDRPPFANAIPQSPGAVNPTGQGSAQALPHEPYPGTAPIRKSGAPSEVQQYRRPDSIPRGEGG